MGTAAGGSVCAVYMLRCCRPRLFCGALNGGGQELLNPGQLGMSAKNALEFHVETTFRTPRAGRSPQNMGPGGSGESFNGTPAGTRS